MNVRERGNVWRRDPQIETERYIESDPSALRKRKQIYSSRKTDERKQQDTNVWMSARKIEKTKNDSNTRTRRIIQLTCYMWMILYVWERGSWICWMDFYVRIRFVDFVKFQDRSKTTRVLNNNMEEPEREEREKKKWVESWRRRGIYSLIPVVAYVKQTQLSKST